MATTRPPGGGATPQARLGIDLSQFQNAPAIARAAGQATSREISNAFKTLHNEQRLAQTQAQQTLAALRAQQAQITAATRAESQVRIQQARAEAQVQQQQARVAAATRIEEERRLTAQVRAEIRNRETAQRAATGSAQGMRLGQFTGAAFGGLGGPLGGVLGGFAGGTPAIAGGLAVAATARAAFEASQTAVAYERQRVAAVNLAGSQQRLNELMVTYDRATGGAIDRSTGLAKVTQLMSVGFADNAQELNQFARAIRGISVAMGASQDTVTQNLILELFSQRGMRLDQLGLQYDAVRKRADELRAADARLTQQQAYQNAVLEQAEQRYGALADSAVGQATGVERLSKAWADFSLTLGQAASGPINGAAHALAILIDTVRGGLEELSQTGQTSTVRGGISIQTNTAGAQNILAGLTAARERVLADIETGARPAAVLQADLAELDAKIRAVNVSLGTLDVTARNATFGSRTSIGRVTPTRIGGFEPEQQAIIADRFSALQQIQRDADREIVESAAQFARQRSQTIANYEKSIAREAEDFGRQRLNAERKLQMSILDVHQDSARQRVRWEADLARTLEEQRAERDERISESREATSERLADFEEKHNKDREKRQRDFGKNIREAVANLDAVQVRELQRQRREENQEARESHAEQIADEQKSLEKRIDDANKAYAKQEQQQRSALDRRIQQQAEDDALRIQEMKDAFAAQTAQEDEERAIRLGRQAEDHAAQLAEMDRAQGERIAQIREREAEAIIETNRAYDVRLQAEGVFNAKLEAEQRRHQAQAELDYATHIATLDAIVKGQVQGPSPLNPMITPGQFPSLVQPVMRSSSVANSRINNGGINITINVPGGTSLGTQELYDVAYQAANDALADTLEGYQQ